MNCDAPALASVERIGVSLVDDEGNGALCEGLGEDEAGDAAANDDDGVCG